MTTVIVSPHLDDAVLSLPATIDSLAARGERVVVLTAFTEGDPGHAVRRAEDRAALALLGAEAVHLGLRDAPQRRGVPHSFRGLVLAALADDDDDLDTVGRTLAAEVAARAPDRIVLPLGVGEHIDHRIVHAAHRRIAGRVGFYEDSPYSHVCHAVRARLLRLGASVDGAVVTGSPAAAGEFLASARAAPHLRAWLPADQHDACLAPFAITLASAVAAPRLHLRCERRAYSRAGLERAVRAIRAYASQCGELFGEQDIGERLAPAGAPYEERIYWRQ